MYIVVGILIRIFYTAYVKDPLYPTSTFYDSTSKHGVFFLCGAVRMLQEFLFSCRTVNIFPKIEILGGHFQVELKLKINIFK